MTSRELWCDVEGRQTPEENQLENCRSKEINRSDWVVLQDNLPRRRDEHGCDARGEQQREQLVHGRIVTTLVKSRYVELWKDE